VYSDVSCLSGPRRRGGDVVVARFRRRRLPLSVQEGYWVVTEGTLHSTAQHLLGTQERGHDAIRIAPGSAQGEEWA
jgi:hypothetical protein